MTATQAIAEAQRDFPDRSTTECLADLQAVHDELTFDFRIAPSSTTINVTSGTAGYALASGTSRIYSVRYTRSATKGDYKTLRPTHKDELDQVYERWRSRDNAEPEMYYIEGGSIYLVPAPNATTSGSYPRLDLDVSSTATLSGGTNLPTLPSSRVYIEGLKARLALRTEDSRYGEYARMYAIERKRLGTILNNQAAYFSPRMLPGSAFASWRTRR